MQISPDFKRLGDDLIAVTIDWTTAEGARDRRYAVLTTRKDRIADMQVCGTWRQAKRFARRAALAHA